MPKSNNHNEAITHLAMPERQIPVLIDSSPEKAEGCVPSTGGSEMRPANVRRLLPSFIEKLRSPGKRKEIEKEHGVINTTEWSRLRELLALIDRVNAGDWSPIINADFEEALRPLPALLDRLSPEGWFLEDGPGTGKMKLRSASGDVRASVSLRLEKIEHGGPLSIPSTAGAAPRMATPPVRSGSTRSGRFQFSGSAEVKTAAYALSEAFTAGLSKTRFVVWWSNTGKKLVPGLYCPDIVTALYALAMWSSGTAGGWAICQNPRCKKDYPRSRAKQRYCSHKCQVAAGMQRYRSKLENKAEIKAGTATRRKKRRGGK